MQNDMSEISIPEPEMGIIVIKSNKAKHGAGFHLLHVHVVT